MRTRTAGQASTEYVALLSLVALIVALAGAGVAAAVPGVGERLVGAIRTGQCIVGGDICRTVDARAAGLEPCLTLERTRRRDTTVDVAVVRLGEHGEWRLALHSDGSALVTRLADREAGGTVGAGFTFSPAGLDVGVSGALTAGYRSARAWRFADARSAAAFLAAAARDPGVADGRPADVSWQGLGARASGSAQAEVAQLVRIGVDVASDAALGVERAGPRRTVSLQASHDLVRAFVDLPGFPSPAAGNDAAVVEVGWERGELRELAFRFARTRGARVEALAARLDLRDPESRAVAEAVLRPRLPGGEQLRALARRFAEAGTVERDVYTVVSEAHGVSLAGRLGVAVGLSHTRVSSVRRLVDAVTWIGGGPARRRFDCLPA